MAAEEVGTGYVLIKPKMDEGAKASLESAGTAAGHGFGTSWKIAAGNLIAQAVTGIVEGAVSAFSDGFNEYANFEQLVGGVETLFKDSADIVQQHASEAYKTAGLSANQYMEQVTSFSASLLQGLGGDTEKAAEYADMAIRDMSDNANKMGSSMESITNAYQGFAKQNYTMLDNLKLGYGGTKKEMERLLADASAIAGVEFDIDNYNDVIEAIHVMQESMGIAGTTFEEGSTTISGSINQLHSAWDNFITGMFNEDADIGALADQLVEALGTVAENVLPVLETLFGHIVDGIANGLTEAMTGCGEAIQTALVEFFEGAIESASSWLDSLFEIVGSVFDSISARISEVWNGILSFLSGIWESIKSAVSGAINAVSTTVSNVFSSVYSTVSSIWSNIQSAVSGAVEAVSSTVSSVFSAVQSTVSGIWSAIQSAIETPINAARDAVGSAIDAIRGFFNFEFHWPHIPLPHFSVSGSPNPLDWLSGNIPSIGIEWYAKGGIVDGPTLIGAGEAGREAIVPLTRPNVEPFAQAVADASGSEVVTWLASNLGPIIAQYTPGMTVRELSGSLNRNTNRIIQGGIA